MMKMKRIPATVRMVLQLLKTGNLETRSEMSKTNKKGWNRREKGRCRMCKKKNETVKHLMKCEKNKNTAGGRKMLIKQTHPRWRRCGCTSVA